DSPVSAGQPREPRFLGAQMKLREKFFVPQRGERYPLSKFRNGLGHRPHAIFILRRKEEGPKKRAVHAIAKSKFGGPQLFQKILREGVIFLKRWMQQSVPVFGSIAFRRFWRSGAHFIFDFVGPAGGGVDAGTAGPGAAGVRARAGAEDFCAVCAGADWACAATACVFSFGAPVKPATPPSGVPAFIPSTSSQRGHELETSPLSARSITSRAILSTTCSK